MSVSVKCLVYHSRSVELELLADRFICMIELAMLVQLHSINPSKKLQRSKTAEATAYMCLVTGV